MQFDAEGLSHLQLFATEQFTTLSLPLSSPMQKDWAICQRDWALNYLMILTN